MNYVFLAGRLGRDPEIKALPTGSVMCRFPLATSEYAKDGKYTEWHNIVAWEKVAGHVQEYLKKGSYCLISGRIKANKWTDKNGEQKSRTEIIAHSVEFGPKEGTPNLVGTEPDRPNKSNSELPF